MKVFFACTIDKYNQNKRIYNQTRRIILSLGHELTFDWTSGLERLLLIKESTNIANKLLEPSLNAIKEVEVVIIDSTIPSFEVGYLINFALHHKKPILRLELETTKDDNNTNILTLPQSDYLEEYYFSENSLEDILIRFLQRNIGGVTARFNIILERKQKNYLDWADRFYKQSKSDIIRDLIGKRASEDLNYQREIRNVT